MNKISKLSLGLIIVLAAFTLTAIAFYFYKNETDEIRKEKYQYLEAISSLKIDQITKWNAERLYDAKFVPTIGKFIKSTSLLISDSNDKDSKDFLFQTLEPIKERHGYKDLFILDKNNRVLFTLLTNNDEVDSFTIVNSKKAIQLDSILFLGFYYCNTHSEIHMDIISPIKDNFGNILGTFILRLDPNQFLFPLIQSWPTPSKTGESLIFRNEGTQLRLLSDVKFKKNLAMNFTMPLKKEEYIGVKGVKEKAGIVEGLDYRGSKVISSIKKVPGTSWYLVSKIDHDEIFSEMIYRAGTITLISVITFLLIGAFTLYLYKQKQSATYKNLFLKEKELSETKGEYKTALYSIGDAVIATDRHSLVKQMNGVAEKLTGWKESEAIGKKLDEVFKIINEVTKQQIPNPVNRVLKEGAIIGLADYTLLISRDGKEIPIADSGAPIKNDADQIIGVILVFRDQTEERAKEKELFESNEKFSKIFQHSSDSISLTDVVTGKIFEVNDGFVKMFGYPRNEAIGKTSIELNLWSDLASRNEIVSRLKEFGSVKNFEAIGNKKDGSKLNGLLSGELLTFNNNNYILFSIKDITERKLFEKELKNSEERFRKAFITSPDSININRLSDGQYVSINNGFTKMTGFTEEEVIGKSSAEIQIWADIKYRNELVEKLKTTNVVDNFEAKFRMKDGNIKDGLMSSAIIELNGEPHIISITRDISDRKKTEEEILKTKIHYQKLIEHAPDGIVQITAEGEFKYVSPSAKRIFGHPINERVNERHDELTHPEDLPKVLGLISDLVNNPLIIPTIEYRFKDYNGNYLWLESTFTNLLNEPNVQAIVINFRDINFRKTVEAKLRTLSQAVEQSPVIIVITDLKGSIEYVNPKFMEVTGYRIDEVKGQNINILKSDMQDKDIFKNLWETILIGNTWRGEINNKKKNGKLYWEETVISPILDTNGNIINFISVGEDITERKKLLNEIISSEEKFRSIWENSVDAMRLINEKGVIINVNESYCNLFGLTKEKIIGNPFNVSYIITESDKSLNGFKERFKNGTILKKFETEINLHSGKVIWVELTNSFIEFEDKPTMLLSIIRDITDRKVMITELTTAKEQAEEMIRLKSYFFANMSHELRTPFVGILGFAEILKDTLQNSDERGYAEQILKSSKRLTDTLNKILNVTRLEFDKVDLNYKEFDVCRLLKSVEVFYYNSAKLNNTKISSVLQAESIMVKSDAKLLEDVLNNLVSNAVKFTKDGIIKLSAEKIVEDKKDCLVIKVEDNGIGIPEEKQSLVWQEFRQASEGMNRSFEGTGLGLTISKKYVEMLGGEISLESKENVGTVFTIKLPLDSHEIKVTESKDKITDPIKITLEKSRDVKHKILYVEDDMVALQFINIILKSTYEVETVFKASAALELTKREQYDAIMLDINLGSGMDGVELMQKIREIDYYKNIPIVAVTAFAAESDRIEFLAKGFTHYISKPFTKNELFSLLKEVFST